MKLVSFNINGLRARLPQLQALIHAHQPDVIGLQEIKVHDEAFPREEVEAMGYQVFFHGQKAHYGVALLCKQQPEHIQRGFPSDDEEAQRRMIMASFTQANGRKLTLLNGYFPQGDEVALADLSHRTETDLIFYRRPAEQCAERAPLFDPAREAALVRELVEQCRCA